MGNCVRHHGDVTVLSAMHIPRPGRLSLGANTTYRSYEDLSPVTSSDSLHFEHVDVEETTTVTKTKKKSRSRIFFKRKTKGKFYLTSSLLKSQDGNPPMEVPKILVTSPGGLCRKPSAAAAAAVEAAEAEAEAAAAGQIEDKNQNVSHFVSHTQIEIPELPFGPYLLQQFDLHGDGIAVIDSQSDRSYRYRDLAELTRRTGSALWKRGFRAGQTLCMVATNSIELPAVLCAVLCSAGTFAIVDPEVTISMLSRRLRDLNASVVITDAPLADTLLRATTIAGLRVEIYTLGYQEGFHTLAELQSDNGSAFPDDVPVEPKCACAMILYSCDTFCSPKAVRLSHYNVMANVLQIKRAMGMKRSSCLACFLPLSHHFGIVGSLLHGICTGTALVLVREAILRYCLAAIIKYKPTIMHVASEMVMAMFEEDMISVCDLSNLETILCATSPLPVEIQSSVTDKLGTTKICQAYGCTETLLTHCGSTLDTIPDGSSGCLLPNTACKILDVTTRQSLPTDVSGEIWVSGPQCMMGYVTDLGNNRKEADDWTFTGHTGRIDSRGYLYVEADVPRDNS